MAWHKFRDRSPKGGGFYVLRYSHREDLPVYMSKASYDPESYFIIYENTRDKGTCHDFGLYIWPTSWHIQYQPTHWRVMRPAEALLFSRKLYQFGREYRWGTEVRSRGALSASSAIIYNKE